MYIYLFPLIISFLLTLFLASPQVAQCLSFLDKPGAQQFFALCGIVMVMAVVAWNFLTRVEVYS